MTTASEKLSFSGHETFPLRSTWLSKAFAALVKDPDVFNQEDAMVRLGVGKNMVRSMRHWSLACGMAEEDLEGAAGVRGGLRVTPLGHAVFSKDGWDPYLEDPGTLWLLHWQLASTPLRSSTWYYAFNLLPKTEFTKEELTQWLLRWAEGRSSRVSENSLRRDVDCFARTYVATKPTRTVPLEDVLACPLTELGLLRELKTSASFILDRGDHITLPNALVAYALCEFLGRRQHRAHTLALEEVAFAEGGPGRVFALSEEALLYRFEQLEAATDGALSFDETAGLRQVIVHEVPEPMDVLSRYFEQSKATALRATGSDV